MKNYPEKIIVHRKYKGKFSSTTPAALAVSAVLAEALRLRLVKSDIAW